eukprot:Gb_35065 [translate_table: standard]
MEVDSKIHPFLSYVLSLRPLRQPLMLTSKPSSSNAMNFVDLEANNKDGEALVNQMPNLRQPELLAKMTAAVSDVVQTRSVLQALGDRPDHEAVDKARRHVIQIESALSKRLEDIVLADAPSGYDRAEWTSHQAQQEKEERDAAEKEKLPYKTVIHLYEMHVAYEDLLKEAEERLVNIYRSSENVSETTHIDDDVDEEVVRILQETSEKQLEKVELQGRNLRFLPEAFGRLSMLVSLNLSNNKFQVLSDSIAGLVSLEILDLSCNLLASLPDSIGLLKSLKLLNVSSNKLKTLPDSISRCSELIELDASYNQLIYLPTNLGQELVKLQKLSVHLNKLRSLPSSVCEMKSLRYLDVHFNELRSLPAAIGNLTNLQVLNASSNFSDLVSIPDSIGELINLVELDLSNNQIRQLPYSFGSLQNLKKLSLDQNPLLIPPEEIVKQGVDAVTEYMAKRWLDYLLEEEQRSTSDTRTNQTRNTWVQWGGSVFGGWISGVKESVTGYLGASNKSHTEDYLEQQY